MRRARDVRMVEIGARARVHRVLRVLVDAFGEPRRALRQIVVELRAQWAPLRMECAGRRIGARLRIRVRGAGVERGRHAIAAVDLEVVELPRLPVPARGPRRAGEVCVRGGIVDADVRIREADQRLRECVGRADADVPLRRCVERVVARDGARGIRAARRQSSGLPALSSIEPSAASVSAPQPIAYHAGAFALPVAAISHVTKNCANPPKIATPTL